MAQFTFDTDALHSDNATPSATPNMPLPENSFSTAENAQPIAAPASAPIGAPQYNTAGMSQAELNDPNRIQIALTDDKAPIVVLFGPPSSGKTMTLIRLTRYLKQHGFQVKPVGNFRPVDDVNYRNLCQQFDSMISSNDAAESTNRINFMLVDVFHKGRRLCQLLEAPGEHYFDPRSPQTPFPAFVNNIISARNRKIWCVLIDLEAMDSAERLAYVERVRLLKSHMTPRDRAIIVLNKIDRTEFVVSPGRIHEKAALREVGNHFPGLFEVFRNDSPLALFGNKYRCDFVPFQTGMFTASSVRMTYQQSADEYPARFWKTILSRLR